MKEKRFKKDGEWYMVVVGEHDAYEKRQTEKLYYWEVKKFCQRSGDYQYFSSKVDFLSFQDAWYSAAEDFKIGHPLPEPCSQYD